jgi:hypothetical protein
VLIDHAHCAEAAGRSVHLVIGEMPRDSATLQNK